jgi:NAD(P)-dependent dehydrogenase (short-subunit alcohol dehydrogenase family)
VVTSSVNGLEAGFGYGHYAVSKHGVIGLVKNVALELAPHGVRCNSVAPANTETPMVLNQAVLDVFACGAGGTPDDLARASSHYHALRGAGTLAPQRIADAVLWLNSDLASAVTGVTVPVDAGHLLLTGYNHAPAL